MSRCRAASTKCRHLRNCQAAATAGGRCSPLSALPCFIRHSGFSLTKPEEAMAVPVRSGYRLGELRQTAEGLTIPREAFLEDHGPSHACHSTLAPAARRRSGGRHLAFEARAGRTRPQPCRLSPGKASAELTCRDRPRHRPAVDRPTFSSIATEGDGQEARRPNGRAIGGAAHRDRSHRDQPRSRALWHRAAAKPPALSLPAVRSWLAGGPCRSRRLVRLRLRLAVVVGRFGLDDEAISAISNTACDSVDGFARVDPCADDGISALA